MWNVDNESYRGFTGPQRLDKQIHTLEGLLRGIAIDGKVNEAELRAVTAWLDDNRQYCRRHPFNEVYPVLEEALEDGILDEEEQQDLLWLCNKLTSENAYFDAATSDMQRLQGVIGGIAADGVITEDELRSLSDWMNEREHLKSLWPYDEIGSIVSEVLKDGKIDEREQKILVAYFNEFLSFQGGRAVNFPDEWKQMTVTGVCSMCPEIEFDDRLFCFTGKSTRAPRKQIERQIADLGGRCSPRVTQELSYLVIGADGNDCWAFACYGRKVEQAVTLRRKGLPIVLVHEFDFWDCVEDA